MASSESALASAKELMRRWRSGEQTAADQLYVRYAERLWHLAEREIGTRLRRRVDADDIIQSVFRTFFVRTARGEFSIVHSGALAYLLERITLNKIRRQMKFHSYAKRNIRRETYPDHDDSYRVTVRESPSPEDARDFVDELEMLMTELNDREAEIVRLILDDFQINEIAKRMGCSRWTVRRLLDRVGVLMYPYFGTDAGG
jgi:RNA polymerase sigma-70 factor (ECF subfamily)